MNELESLRTIQEGERLSSSAVFDAIFAAGSVLSDDDRESDTALEIAIRLLEAKRNQQVPAGCVDAIELLAEECGLYPYVDPSRFNLLTQTVIEAHSVNLRGKLYLHSKQIQVDYDVFGKGSTSGYSAKAIRIFETVPWTPC